MSIIREDNVSINIKNLSLSFGKTKVLKRINLLIKPGEFFTFLGPSGSGKSTLLRAIAGFGPFPNGDIEIGKDNVTRMPPWNRNVGMVFQSYALWPHMTVRKNVSFGLEERKVNRKEIKDRVDEVLNLIGLIDLAERRPSQLSGGQQQRVALARTIVVKPRVLLLDEPLSNLDANLRVQMRRDILKLQKELKLTTIFVTHDQEEANTTSDRIAVLDQGIIQQVGSPIELYDKPINRFVANFLGTANLVEKNIKTLGGTLLFDAQKGKTAMFRPQDVTIQTANTSKISDTNCLDGQVEQREFLGNLIRYSVSVGNHSIIVDDPHYMGEPNFSEGEKVKLYLNAKNIRVLNN